VVDLRVTLGRLQLKNPVLAASGTSGYVREMAGFMHLEGLGGAIPKTVTFRPRAGNPTPRMVETPSGMLNAIGLDNDGISHFREHHLPYLRTVGTAVIANPINRRFNSQAFTPGIRTVRIAWTQHKLRDRLFAATGQTR